LEREKYRIYPNKRCATGFKDLRFVQEAASEFKNLEVLGSLARNDLYDP
jgi:hypothetical protein